MSLFSSDMVENRQTGIFKLMLLLLDKLVWFRKRLTNRKAFLSLHLKKLKKETKETKSKTRQLQKRKKVLPGHKFIHVNKSQDNKYKATVSNEEIYNRLNYVNAK